MKRTTIFFIAMAATLSSAVGVGQNRPSIDDLLRRLANDDSAAEAAGGLARHSEDSRVLPALRARFQTATAKFTKQSIALSLVKLNVQDPAYFNYLASFALEAANDDAPFPYVLAGREPNYQSFHPVSVFVGTLAENFLAHHRNAQHLMDKMNHLLRTGKPVQVTVDDDSVEAVIYKNEQAAKQLCESLHRSSPSLFSS